MFSLTNVVIVSIMQDNVDAKHSAEDVTERENLMEDMSMPMSVPDNASLDCSALQRMWDNDHRSIAGSDLQLILEECDRGFISTADEVAEAIEAFEGPGNPSIDEQLAIMADETCENNLTHTDQDFDEVRAACEEDPHDNEQVLDALARLSARHTPDQGTFFS